ncbi:ArsC family reductase [Paraferrimonas sedimenticola]|uniref:Arsenate reductase n=1 Tax=Paraferrimonas sedimenticola TaxID=375674 RepID=A0AA37W009_9GAMM|nr:ArsC family reductase [Paraferrimonas sedimenticola]GLP94752.1 arsenate reductase [Paraferrimonas sedimenticola]
MTTLYGIKNCDSVKKAQKFLNANEHAYQFHDFVSQGLSEETIDQWLEAASWEVLLNKRSTNFRALSDDDKQDIDQAKAKALMLANPKLVKRPVLIGKQGILVGFKAEQYQAWLKA